MNWETRTSETGSFEFKKLAPGRYIVGVSHSGFEPFESEEIPITGENTEHVDVELAEEG